MKKLWHIAGQSVHLPWVDKAEDTLRSFTSSGRALFLFFAGMMIVSTAGLLYLLESSLVVAAPASGGALTEGILGSPRFINPLLAVSDADRDLTALVYSGLLKATSDGAYIPDLAASYEVSPDGLTYTFVLREGASFHDGTPVTAADVLFTILKAQDATIKSPMRANWSGVEAATVDERTVRFTLRSPYAPFIENMTLGVLPKHLWDNVSAEEFPFSELNTSPVGSGPYKVHSVARSAGGIPSSYTLASFGKYTLGEPYLRRITLRFYQSEDALLAALARGDIESGSGITPARLVTLEKTVVVTSPLNRVFGIFFNQNQSEVLRLKEVRQALSEAVDRDALVAQVLGGYGTALHGPVPPAVLPLSASSSVAVQNGALAARELLISKGWELGEDGVLEKTTGSGTNKSTTRLAFRVATGNVPELRAAAEHLRNVWQQVGADVSLEVYEPGDLSQNVIRPRKYDALLFGQVIGRELDLFAFWHSSQRNDPGLNIALYANAAADDALETLRESRSEAERAKLYQAFETELRSDIPAVFLYVPDFVYSVPNDLKGLNLGFIETPSDRFLSVTQWHRETDYVWPFFVKQ